VCSEHEVLNSTAEKFGHRFGKAPAKTGLAMACMDYDGTHMAAMAEVKVNEKSGKVRLKKDDVCAGYG